MEQNTLAPYNEQTGGHEDTLFMVDDGKILLKLYPNTSQELGNYEKFNAEWHHYSLYTPHFYGTQGIDGKTFLKLENLTYGFTSPCVVDIKIGLRPFAPDASESKQRVQTKKFNATTGCSLGLRLIAMKRYEPLQKLNINYPKSFGIEITTKERLKAALRLFFSYSTEKLDSEILHQPQCSSYQESNADNFPMHSVFHQETVKQVLIKVEQLRDFFEKTPKPQLNFYSSSLLIVYEGNQIESQDHLPEPKVKMIDFQHVFERIPDTQAGKEEDGYVFGLQNLSSILQELLNKQ
ncbi:MAG: hypothetical protein EZS28_011124 [Streblomastix strix]|uniref:Kinase n=1 Tax=Streblomastix strix TaxID=222440 RepID=A0A5J4WEG4_9EUKA|nr:MAG: hypothetical protein EZS28_011124 [Streblomastix strix]